MKVVFFTSPFIPARAAAPQSTTSELGMQAAILRSRAARVAR
jgi:hypothetical protein